MPPGGQARASLIRRWCYAGQRPGRAVIGDAAHLEITRLARELGWRPGDPPRRFDLLPLIIQSPGSPPACFELPADAVLDVPLATRTWPGSVSCGSAGTRFP